MRWGPARLRADAGAGAPVRGPPEQNRASRGTALETLLLGGLLLVGLALLLPTDLLKPRPARLVLLGLLGLGTLGLVVALVVTGQHLGEIAKDGVCRVVRAAVHLATLMGVTVPCRILPEHYLGLRLLPLALALVLFGAVRLLVRAWRLRRHRGGRSWPGD